MWVQEVTAAKQIAEKLGGKSDSGDASTSGSSNSSSTYLNGFQHIFSDMGGKMGDTFKSLFGGLSGIFSKLLGGGGFGFGSILGGLGGLFGGFRSGGGDTYPGKAYVVGEEHPEIFVPDRPGHIVPNFANAPSMKTTVVQAHFHGVRDADSFKASQSQVLNHLASAVGRAVSRR